MKKSILIFCAVVAAFSLTALGYANWNNTSSNHEGCSSNKAVVYDNDFTNVNNYEADLDLYFDIRNRWSTMTKENLIRAKSLNDIVPGEADKTRDSYKNVTISVLHNDKDVRDIETMAMGQSVELNNAQINLLRSCDYSTNLRFTALNRLLNPETGIFRDDSLVYYMTITPEKEAEYEGGFDTLIDYLKEISKEEVAIIKKNKLQPGKVFFTVSKDGTISNVKLVSTSGYPSVDTELKNIINNMPKKWEPARNSKGEKVDQEFVFFFGIMGC
jgi:hypothetical protein